MKTWHTSSTEKNKCIVTKRMTGTYIVFDAYGISLKVPLLNDKDYDALAKKKSLIDSLMKAQKEILVSEAYND